MLCGMHCLNQRRWSAKHGSVLSRLFSGRTCRLAIHQPGVGHPSHELPGERRWSRPFSVLFPATINRLSAWSQAGKWKLQIVRSLRCCCAAAAVYFFLPRFDVVPPSVLLQTMHIAVECMTRLPICFNHLDVRSYYMNLRTYMAHTCHPL